MLFTELKQFGLEMSLVYGVLAHFEPKNQTRKILNYIKSLCAKLF